MPKPATQNEIIFSRGSSSVVETAMPAAARNSGKYMREPAGRCPPQFAALLNSTSRHSHEMPISPAEAASTCL